MENCYLSVGVNRLLQVLTDQLLVNCVLCDVGGNEFELKCVISARPRWVTTELESPELTSGKARESCWPSEKNNAIVCVCSIVSRQLEMLTYTVHAQMSTENIIDMSEKISRRCLENWGKSGYCKTHSFACPLFCEFQTTLATTQK